MDIMTCVFHSERKHCQLNSLATQLVSICTPSYHFFFYLVYNSVASRLDLIIYKQFLIF